MRIAITADLHWGQNSRGDQANLALQEFLRQQPPDLLLLGGDQGTAEHFQECLELFQDLPCPKAVVPGNHDLWVNSDDGRGDSLQVYQEHLPALCNFCGYVYLDREPLILAEHQLAIVGSINWYDYSWSLEKLQQEAPDWEYRLRHKAFTRGSHNDRRFVRWPLDDVRFTQLVVDNLAKHLSHALAQVDQAIVLTHHPAFYGLNFPRDKPAQGWDSLLWDALAGNTALEKVLEAQVARIPFVFSGHTHRARENNLGPIRGYNIGGDYTFKRLLLLDWPGGEVQSHLFGEVPNIQV
jgi:predicted phosphohydrolase